MGLWQGRRITMRCASCGRSNRPDATFCDACGARLVGMRQPASLADRVFVGRQAELGVLQAALEDVLAGRGRLIMLVGEARHRQDPHRQGIRDACGTTQRSGTLGALPRERGCCTLLALGADYPGLRPGTGCRTAPCRDGCWGSRYRRHRARGAGHGCQICHCLCASRTPSRPGSVCSTP